MSAQKRNDPTKSHCARRIKSLRTRDGRASHSSSVSRPGKLRVGRRRVMVLALSLVTTGLFSLRHHRAPFSSSPPGLTRWSMLSGRVHFGPMSICEPSMDHRVKPGGDEQRVIGERSHAVLRTAMPGDDEFLRSRDAASHPSFAHAKKSQAKKHSQENSSLKRREAERREAHRPEPHRKAMRRASFLLPPIAGGPRPRTLSLGPHGAGALAFRRPTAASEVFGLGSAQAALPGTTGCKREDPLRHQCSEHLAVRHAPDGTMPKPPASAVYRCARREPLPLRPKEYPRERRPFASGILVR